MSALTTVQTHNLTATDQQDYVTLTIAGQLFGIPVLAVHDVTERAWLKAFLDGWLARMPHLADTGLVMAQAAE